MKTTTDQSEQFIEIKSIKDYQDLKDDYTHILRIKDYSSSHFRFFLLKHKTWDCSVNDISIICGYSIYDSDMDHFFGCGFDDADCVNSLLEDIM